MLTHLPVLQSLTDPQGSAPCKDKLCFFPPFFFFLETREIIALIWDMSVYKQEKCCSVVLWDLGRKVHCVLPASSASGEKCLVQALSSGNVEIT